jgi:hypothetical protein
VRITVTATDKAGHSAAAPGFVQFAQTFSSQSRAGCPRALIERVRSFAGITLHPTATATTVTTAIPCKGRLNCAISYKITALVARASTAGAAKARQTTIATSGLVAIPAGHSKRVKTKLTSAGRRLLRKRIKATLAITSVAPTGKRTTQRLRVTLGGKKR